MILQFDNVHSERDNRGVPSDLEQMPALRNFLTSNGALLTNDHTILISHTAGGIVSTETGLYPDRNGLTVTNSYQYFDPNAPTTGNVGGSDFTSAFKYWTDPVSTGNDTTFNNDTTGGANTPAPWVPVTRAGCDFAGLGAANMELENTSSDLTSVFPGFDFGTLTENATNLEGIAIHCSLADSTANGVCAHGEADNLPDEPTGYGGFKGLFGAFEVNSVLTGGSYTGANAAPAPIFDIFAPDATNTPKAGEWAPPAEADHNADVTPPPDSFTAGTTTTSEVLDSTGHPGFPGFDGQEANNALAETAAAQEAGIPVTYTYLSDVHDDHYHRNGGKAFGPGQAGDVEKLKEYNAAFAAFFQRLANDGITVGPPSPPPPHGGLGRPGRPEGARQRPARQEAQAHLHDPGPQTPAHQRGLQAVRPARRNARAVVALSRGKRIVGWGSGPAKRTIRLHHRRHLRGRYRLTVTVTGGTRVKHDVRFR